MRYVQAAGTAFEGGRMKHDEQLSNVRCS